MTNDLSDLIRAVQQQAAASASPDRLYAAITVRSRSLRRRRTIGTVLAAAVAVVAFAVAIPFGLASHHRAVPLQVPPPAAGIAMKYRITELPAGFTERARILADPSADNPEIQVVRSWGVSATQQLTLFVQRKPDSSYYDQGAKVDVDGAAGWYDELSTTVSWLAGDELLQVRASGLDLPEATVLSAARSVRPDATRTRLPLSVAWLPAGYTLSSWVVQGDSAARWQCRVFASSDPQDAPDSRFSLTITLGSTTTAPPGGPLLVVGGRPARALDGEGNSRFLVVTEADGLLLTVSATWPADGAPVVDDALIHVATATTRTGDPAATSWIGSR